MRRRQNRRLKEASSNYWPAYGHVAAKSHACIGKRERVRGISDYLSVGGVKSERFDRLPEAGGRAEGGEKDAKEFHNVRVLRRLASRHSPH
jgi:hypothetical protein